MSLAQNTSAPKVLLVEDSRIAQIAAEMVIHYKACELMIATSGEEAVELANQDTYDIILMDIGLSGITGFDATIEIRKNSLLNKNTLIYALTAHGEPQYYQKAIQVDMDGYLEKPLRTTQLEEVFDALKNKRAIRVNTES
jgi:CheY-like chemotaxis protein